MLRHLFPPTLSSFSPPHPARSYLARRQVLFDVRLCAFGSLIYVGTAIAVAQGQSTSLPMVLVPLAYSLICLGPPIMAICAPETYYRWRNLIFVAHFYLHHVSAPVMLLRLGLDMPRRLPPLLLQSSPMAFFLSLTFFRTLLWQFLNVMMYRLRVGIYWIAQPLILLAAAPHELSVCTWAAEQYPKETAAVYNNLITWARLMAAMLHPVLPPLMGPDLEHLTACRRIHAFLLFFVGFLVPGIIIWRLERHIWQEFLAADVAVVAWPGGPSQEALRSAQRALREEERSRRTSLVDAGRAEVAAAAAVMGIVWWTASDLFV
jgi:hypothetical protein